MENNQDSPNLTAAEPKKSKKYCKVCGDIAPMKYYGVLSCDGCKSFFRRALRGKQVFECRFDRNCVVTKDKRTKCRQCRLKKCLEVGMRKEALQDDRDPIRYRKPIEENPNDGLTFTILVQADELVKGPSKIMLGKEMLVAGDKFLTTERKLATIKRHYDSLREQLLVMVKWAQSIPVYCQLAKEDKVALLQAHATEYTIIAVARRSIPLNSTNDLLMGNGYLLSRELEDVSGVNGQIIDELVIPFRELNVDDTEFALLKGIVFFDPSARGLSDKKRIQTLRRQAQLLLEEYIKDRQLESPGRLSEILLRLLPLQSIAKAMSEEIQYRKFFGIAYADKLLREMILGEDVNSDNASNGDGGEEEGSLSPQMPWQPWTPGLLAMTERKLSTHSMSSLPRPQSHSESSMEY